MRVFRFLSIKREGSCSEGCQEPITKTPFSGVYPFLLTLAFCGLLLFIFPSIATWLPSVMYGR